MTEEIIIDGVNVNECKYFNKVVNEEPYCNIDEEHLYTCSSDENCYFKQLKRLEQERDELKQENERLQSEIRQKKMTIMMNNDHYLTVDENNRKYSSVLEEIRRIIVINKDEFDYCLHHDYDEQILNKINEVLK